MSVAEKEFLAQKELLLKLEEKIVFLRMATAVMEMPFFKELLKTWPTKMETKETKP